MMQECAMQEMKDALQSTADDNGRLHERLAAEARKQDGLLDELAKSRCAFLHPLPCARTFKNHRVMLSLNLAGEQQGPSLKFVGQFVYLAVGRSNLHSEGDPWAVRQIDDNSWQGEQANLRQNLADSPQNDLSIGAPDPDWPATCNFQGVK